MNSSILTPTWVKEPTSLDYLSQSIAYEGCFLSRGLNINGGALLRCWAELDSDSSVFFVSVQVWLERTALQRERKRGMSHWTDDRGQNGGRMRSAVWWRWETAWLMVENAPVSRATLIPMQHVCVWLHTSWCSSLRATWKHAFSSIAVSIEKASFEYGWFGY